jgi:dTDP-4-amino-4,6-dideoxygalactose transaminase
LKKLNNSEIGAAQYYPIPVHKIPFYKSNIKLPNTDWASKSVLSLPVNPKVTSKNIHYIAKTLGDLLAE